MNAKIQISELLIDIEYELRKLDAWEHSAPSKDALSSVQPFSIDTLKFTQWLQFIFIPKIRDIVESNGLLPEKCEITPMAEEYFRDTKLAAAQLLHTLRKIDQIITKN